MISTYVVIAGDNLSAIAVKYGVTIANLMAWNPAITDPNLIQVGQTLIVSDPANAEAVVPPPVVTATGTTFFTVPVMMGLAGAMMLAGYLALQAKKK